MDNPSLFDQPDTGGIPLTRTPDHDTSEKAADKVRSSVTELQRAIFQHIKMMERVTALELEELEAFQHLAPSTVRKRVSELARRGKLIGAGRECYVSKRTKRTSYAIAWSVFPGATL